MKFGHLIEYEKCSSQKSYTKCGGDLVADHFLKRVKIEHISGSRV